MQKPRTIEDHKTRYPRIQPLSDIDPNLQDQSSVEEPSGEELIEIEQLEEYIDPDDYPMRQPDASSSPPRPPTRSASLPDNPPIELSPELVSNYAPSEISNTILDIPSNEEDGDANFLQGVNMDAGHDYPFDYLEENRPRDDLLNDVPPEVMDEHQFDPEMEDENDVFDDEDFGLLDNKEIYERRPAAFQFDIDEELVDNLGEEYDDEPLGMAEGDGNEHRAFREHELIRNAYIDAFIQKTVFGATHRALKHQLRAARRTISANPNVPHEDIVNMAQTIRTAETRLGVNTQEIITTYTLCPKCRRRYSPEYISTAESETCLNAECEGLLFSTQKLASGRQRRVSNLTYPFASLIKWIKHLLSLPGMSELMQHWRNDESDHGLSEPIPNNEWMENLDINQLIGNISDGWGWRSTAAGLERRIDPRTGDVIDHCVVDPPIRFVSLPFGLSLTLNTDWFQTSEEQNYSVGACYLAVNNLPRHLRFLRENISLCLIMPGPSEPNDYALDQMLEPLIDELLKLKQGVRMTVWRGDPPIYEEQTVHAELSQHIADLIARIKMGGGASLKSEVNFCLYCHSRLSSLSVATGYIREGFQFRDPHQELRNVYRWRSLASNQERRRLFNETGNRFTALHLLPGWHTSTSSPIDAMHILYLGATNWIVKQVLVAAGVLNRRRPADDDPQDVFNQCLESMWVPKSFQRLPPKLGQTRGTAKADQWKLTSRILYIPLYMALRTGDEIGNSNAPAGVNMIDKRSVTPAEIAFGQQLLELLCKDYATHNVLLPPNFHYLMHLEESILKYGSVYNSHVWGMERANKIVSQVNHNGKSRGVLEGTLMRGWWNYTTIQSLIEIMRSIPNPTESDRLIIEDLLMALQGGAEHAHQQGKLMDFVARCQNAYTQLYGIQEPIRLSGQSRMVDLEALGIYELVLQFCIDLWPGAGIFGRGMVHNLYFPPVGMTRNHSYVEFDGIRYGAHTHTSGKGYCYGYIDNRYPVRIERILHVNFPEQENMKCVCALVRGFQPPQVAPYFPWDTWAGHLGTASWEYDALDEPILVSVNRFSGCFALFDVPTSYGRYWVTVALDSVSPEHDPVGDVDE
ncbi:Transposase family tnp2 [Ceratobasidium sp. AG-Ba]|nr:Transposase family tnp2 [Ceratobasidium sp. AG-Ba]